jgi:predicted Rossmann fold nucleotide-binding protein DprA/Smf involved in DNA uptake
MTESEIVNAVVEGLRSISQGVEAIAKKLEDSFSDDKPKAKRTRKSKVAPKAKKAQVKKKATAKKAVAKPAAKKKVTAANTVLAVISRSRKGVGVSTISEKTGFDKKKVTNLLYKLKKAGKIKAVSRGLYAKV